jgi:hypothetical protein
MPQHRYHAVARKLEHLPPELVHQVLDDLPFTKIVELVSLHDVPYLDTALLSHFHLSKFITSDHNLSSLKQYFKVYTLLCQRREGSKEPPHPDIDFLQHDLVYFANLHPEDPIQTYHAIIDQIKIATLHLLSRYTPYLPALSEFAPEPFLAWEFVIADPVSLSQQWTSLDAAEVALNDVKANQLRRLVTILTQYPEMLRRSTYNSQEPRLHALRHHVDWLQSLASKMTKPQVIKHRPVAQNIFADHKLPFVPYDRYLRCFSKVLQKYPSVEGPLVYPPEVVASITKAVQGMTCIYTKQSVEGQSYSDIVRTRYSRYSLKDVRNPRGKGTRQPIFVGIEDSMDSMTFNDSHIYQRNDAILPFEEKEFEWLEAFLQSCKFMESMQDVEWSPGVTVAQFWRLHTGLQNPCAAN